MRRAPPFFSRFLSKFALEMLPAATASVAAGALLTYFHLGRAPDQTDVQRAEVVQTDTDDGQTSQSQRELTRQLLKARREAAETPAQVIPRPQQEAAVAPADAIDTTAPAAEPRARTAREPSREIASRTVAAVPASPTEAAPSGSQPEAVGEPMVITAAAEPEMRAEASSGPIGSVFSAVSVLTGKAVNATGDTLSWVVELPGRIVSTGGKLLEKSAPASPRKEAL